MIKVGVLGFAHGHIGAYGKYWSDHPETGVRITALWDSDPSRRKQGVETFGCAEFDSAEALVASPDIDAIVISSETKYHAQLAVLAADAKKNIIIYKPMALTLAEADSIVEAVERNGVRATVGWQMRCDPQNIKIKELYTSGVLGTVAMYRRRHSLSTHEWAGFENTWHNSRELNRDIFADDSSHPIDMLNWIFGMPETVMCEMSTVVNPAVPNDTGIALFRYKNGMIADISCQFTTESAEIGTEVYGTLGTVQQYYNDNPSTKLPHPQGGLKWHIHGDPDWTVSDIPSPAGHGERIYNQGRQLAEFLTGGEPVCSVGEARDSLRLVLACYLSASLGERVRVDDPRVYDIV